MDQKISEFVRLFFSELPYSEETEIAKKKIGTALEEEYRVLSADLPEEDAWEALLSRYGTLSKMARLAGYSEENAKDDAPGKFDVSDSAVLESTLAVPEDSADLLKNAASLTHMMNLNTFTAGAFQLKDSKNADKFAKAMKESIENRRWVCGFPDKFVIIKVNGYVVSAFGAEDLIDTFKSKTLKAYQDAKVYCEENIE